MRDGETGDLLAGACSLWVCILVAFCFCFCFCFNSSTAGAFIKNALAPQRLLPKQPEPRARTVITPRAFFPHEPLPCVRVYQTRRTRVWGVDFDAVGPVPVPATPGSTQDSQSRSKSSCGYYDSQQTLSGP